MKRWRGAPWPSLLSRDDRLLHSDGQLRQPIDAAGNDLHVREDAVCPRCLQWVEEGDFVRRSAFGPVVHEVCPDLVPGARPRSTSSTDA